MTVSPTRPLAVVTGASSGLGASFARALVQRGYDLLVVARRKDRLEALAAELRRSGAQVEVAVHDLATSEGVDGLISRVRGGGRPVALLVNNAGFGRYATLTEISPEVLREMVQVNVVAFMMLSRAIGADMFQGAGGSILSVASTASFQPVPHFSAYAATKAFVLSLSESMHVELGPKVRVLAVCPGYTDTEFHDAAGGMNNDLMRFKPMDPARVVSISLRALDRGRAVVIPGITNKIQVLLTKFSPRPMVRWTAKKLFEPRK